MQAPTPMDVDKTAVNSDPPAALAQAHLPDARATAQNDGLPRSEQARAQDWFYIGLGQLCELVGIATLRYPKQLPPPADSLDFHALDGLARAVAHVFSTSVAAPRAEVEHCDRMLIVEQAGNNGFTSYMVLAYLAARVLHLSPAKLLGKEAGDTRDDVLKIGKRLHKAHATNLDKLKSFERALSRRGGATDTSADERIAYIRTLRCSVTKAELEAAFALAPLAPPSPPPPASPPPAQSAAATPVSQRSIAMPVEEYTLTIELTKRVSELEADTLQLKQDCDSWKTRAAVAESGSLAAEKAAAAERARADRAEATSTKLVEGERRRAQRAVEAANEAVRKAEALRDADVRHLNKELRRFQDAYFEADARLEAARAAAERERELEARVRELEKQLGARQAQLDSAERKLSLLHEHSIDLQKAAAGAACAASAAAKHERIAERTLKRTAAELERATASQEKLRRATVLASARIEGLTSQVDASKRLRGPETAARLASLTFEVGRATQKLDAAALREKKLKFARGELQRERNLAWKASTAAARAAAVRPPVATPKTIDKELDEELERTREQSDARARELSDARAALKQLRLEVARLKAIAEPTCADIKTRRADIELVLIGLHCEYGVSVNQSCAIVSVVLAKAGGIKLPTRTFKGKEICALPQRTTAQRLVLVGGEVGKLRAAFALAAAAANDEAVGSSADGGSCGGNHIENLTVRTREGYFLADARPTDGRGDAASEARAIAAALDGLGERYREARVALAAHNIDSALLPPGVVIGLAQLGSMTNDSASKAQKVITLLGELKRKQAVRALGLELWFKLVVDPACASGAQSFVAAIRTPDGQTHSRSFLAPKAAPRATVAEPRESDAPRANEPEPPAEFVETMGEWAASLLSEDEQTRRFKVVEANCLFHSASHTVNAASDAVESIVLEVLSDADKSALYALFTNGGKYLEAKAARGEVERAAPNGSYDFFTNVINHLSHNVAKSCGKEATKDWSHRDELESLIRQADFLPDDEVIPLARIGRTCGARAGGVTLLCVELEHWAAALIAALQRKQSAGDKLGGIQSYILAALQNDTIRAAIRAKAIVASLIYVPTLDCLQQLEASPEGADALADACQHIYHWLEHASTDEGAARVLRGEIRLFEASDVESKADARLKQLLGKVYKPAQQGEHGAEPHYDPLVVRMVKAAFAAAAIKWHHHSARFQSAASALNPEDVNWRKHGGVLTNLTGQMAAALRGACVTACGVERSHGMNAANLVRDKRSTPYARAAMLMAGYNKAATWALKLSPAERTVLLRYAKARADADRVTDRKRKADAAELEKPIIDARIAAKKARDEKKAADRQEIVDLPRATCWADIITLQSTELLKQIKVYQVVEGNTSIVISRDASSRSARMLFLAELIASKYGEAQASAGCSRDRLYEMAQVKAPQKERTPGARPRARTQREWAWIGILDMRIEQGRQQFKLLWEADESGTMWEPSWAFAACMNMTEETLEEIAVHNRVDECDPSVLANDALVNALIETAPADGDRVLVEKKGGLAAGKLVGAYAETGQISVLFDGSKKASACDAASLVSLAPPRRATTVANAPVRAIYPADDGHRQWFYGVVERAASDAELVTVKFDDGSVSTVAVYDLQCARTNNWLGDDR